MRKFRIIAALAVMALAVGLAVHSGNPRSLWMGFAVGAITIPDRLALRVTTGDSDPNNGQYIPAVAGAAITNPGPVAVDVATSPAEAGNASCIQAAGDAGRAGYLGYNILPNVGAGASLAVYRGVIVEGLAGMTVGAALYIDDTSADASGTASGLVHVEPATGKIGRIGVAISATKARFA